jgi:hypothetical protein
MRETLRQWFAEHHGNPDDPAHAERYLLAEAAVKHMQECQGQASQDNDVIHIRTQVASRTLEPAVILEWGMMACTMAPLDARSHAYGILEAANAAETDGFVVAWIKNSVGIEDPKAIAGMLLDFRRYREQKMRGFRQKYA